MEEKLERSPWCHCVWWLGAVLISCMCTGSFGWCTKPVGWTQRDIRGTRGLWRSPALWPWNHQSAAAQKRGVVLSEYKREAQKLCGYEEMRKMQDGQASYFPAPRAPTPQR